MATYTISPFRITGYKDFIHNFLNNTHWFDMYTRYFIWGDYQVGKTSYIIKLVRHAHSRELKTIVLTQNLTDVKRQTHTDFSNEEKRTHESALLPYDVPSISGNIPDSEKLSIIKKLFVNKTIVDLGNSNTITQLSDYLDFLKEHDTHFYSNEIAERLVLFKDEGDLLIPYLTKEEEYSQAEFNLRRLETHCRSIIDISATLFPSLYTSLNGGIIVDPSNIILIPNDAPGYMNQFDCVLHDLADPYRKLNKLGLDADLNDFLDDVIRDPNDPLGLITITQNKSGQKLIEKYINKNYSGFSPLKYNGEVSKGQHKVLADHIFSRRNFGTTMVIAGKMVERGIRCASSDYSSNTHVTYQLARTSKSPNYPHFGQISGRICGKYNGGKDRHLYASKEVMEQFREYCDLIPKAQDLLKNDKNSIGQIVVGNDLPKIIKLQVMSPRHSKGMGGNPLKRSSDWLPVNEYGDNFLSKPVENWEEHLRISKERYGDSVKTKKVLRKILTLTQKDFVQMAIHNPFRDGSEYQTLCYEITTETETKLIFVDVEMSKELAGTKSHPRLISGSEITRLKVRREEEVMNSKTFSLDIFLPGPEGRLFDSSQLYLELPLNNVKEE